MSFDTRAPRASAIASARLRGSPSQRSLISATLGFDRLLAAVVGDEHDVDQLGELLDDLLDVLRIAAAQDRHAREARASRPG